MESEKKCLHYEKLKPLTDAMDEVTSKLAKKIVRNSRHVKPRIKTRGMFWVMHFVQRKGFNSGDAEYWKAKGWTDKKDLGNKKFVI